MKKLTGNQILVGHPVPFDCYDGQGNLLLKKGLIVASQKQVDFLVERGLYRQLGDNPGKTDMDKPGDRPLTPFQLLNLFNTRLKQIFSTVITDASDERGATNGSFVDRLLCLADDIQALCRLDADAVLGAIHLDSSGRYSVVHPLHRALVCELIGARKAIVVADRRRLIAAALSCDLSIMKLQDDLIRQAQPLQPLQKQSIRSHPLESVRLLASFGVSDAAWTTAVIQHHELLNGQGYPLGLVKDAVSEWARILTLADIYTAMITPRAYRKALLSKAAMRDIFLKRGSEIDEELAIFIVKELGVYPPGAFVKLQSGELAIVIHRGANPKAPTVKAVVGPRGAPFEKPVPRKTDIREYEIIDVVERDPIVVIDLHGLWGYEA